MFTILFLLSSQIYMAILFILMIISEEHYSAEVILCYRIMNLNTMQQHRNNEGIYYASSTKYREMYLLIPFLYDKIL